jgi:hypothetical protein
MDLHYEEDLNLKDNYTQNKEIVTDDNKNYNKLANKFKEYLPNYYNQNKNITKQNNIENNSKTNYENQIPNFSNNPKIEEKLNKNKEDKNNVIKDRDSI